MNWKGYGGKLMRPNLTYYPKTCLQEPKKKDLKSNIFNYHIKINVLPKTYTKCSILSLN